MTDAARQLNRAAATAAGRMEEGTADVKELKELAAVLQTLAGLEKVLEPLQAAGKKTDSTVRVVLSEEAEELSQ